MIYHGHCPRCKKDDAEYLLLQRDKPRKGAVCDDCKIERNRIFMKNYYPVHRMELLAAVKRWRERNKDYMDNYKKEYYRKNRVKLLIDGKKYREAHPGYMREYMRKRRALNGV